MNARDTSAQLSVARRCWSAGMCLADEAYEQKEVSSPAVTYLPIVPVPEFVELMKKVWEG